MMNIERLKLMADVMGEVVAGTWTQNQETEFKYADHAIVGNVQFNLSWWMCSVEPELNQGCGFSACAIGHASVDARFNALGWSYVDHSPRWKDPQTDRVYAAWTAVERFFGIEWDTAEYLFMSEHYPNHDVSAAQVLIRLNLLLEVGQYDFGVKIRKEKSGE